MNIFYPRSLISLIIIISFIKKKRINKKKNILILEKIYFSNFINSLSKKNILHTYFETIKLISTPETDHKIFLNNYLKFYFIVNNKIKELTKNSDIKEILKIKFNNFYGAGTYLDEVFYKINKDAKFYFVEHGIGNILNFSYLNIIKLKINYFIKFFLNIIFFNTRIKYYGYIGILNKYFENNLYINECKVKENIKVTSANIKKIFKIFINFYIKTNFLKINDKKEYILFNWNFLIKPEEKFIIKIINKQKINYKNNILVIKLHNKTMYSNHINYKLLINILHKNKINFLVIDKKISFLPLEFFIYYLRIKKVISLMSSTAFYASIIYPKTKISLYLSLNKNFKKKYFSFEHSLKAIEIYKKKFKMIDYYL
jgi:hypothetical protein